jgi:hypothetical protein
MAFPTESRKQNSSEQLLPGRNFSTHFTFLKKVMSFVHKGGETINYGPGDVLHFAFTAYTI